MGPSMGEILSLRNCLTQKLKLLCILPHQHMDRGLFIRHKNVRHPKNNSLSYATCCLHQKLILWLICLFIRLDMKVDIDKCVGR